MNDEIAIGTRLKITGGAFQGLTATVLVDDGDDKVDCEVDIFGRATKVAIPRTDLALASTAMTGAMMADIEAKVAEAARMRSGHDYRRMLWLVERQRAGVRDEDLADLLVQFRKLNAEIEEAQLAAEEEALTRLRAAFAPLSPEEQFTFWEGARSEWTEWWRNGDVVRAYERALLGDELSGVASEAAVTETARLGRELLERAKAAARDPARWKDDLDGTTPIAANAELEAAIERAPGDTAAYLVYADFLQAHADPRGELIVCQNKGKRVERRSNEILDEHERYFVGGLARHQEVVTLEWRLGFIREAKVMVLRKHEEEGLAQADLVRTLLALPSARFLETLTLGCTSCHEQGVGADILALVDAGPRPTLRRLAIAVDLDEEMLSWTETGDLALLWPLYRGLASLDIVAGSLELGAIDLPLVETLRIKTCGLSSSNVRALAQGNLPALESLELWFGDGGRDPTRAKLPDVGPLLESPALARVNNLGLVNTAFTDSLCELLVNATVFTRIEYLDLSRGTMTDAGAFAIAEARSRAPRLRAIDVRENYLSPDGVDALKTAGFSVRADNQRDEEGDEGATYRYCAVAE